MKLQFVDVFAKTAEDARVRTSSGGIVSLVAFAVSGWSSSSQSRSYWSSTWDHKSSIDTSQGGDMSVFLDISFAHIPCDSSNVDAIDDRGDVRMDIMDSLTKTESAPDGSPVDQSVRQQQRAFRDAAIAARDPDTYDGPCYGAEDGSRRLKKSPKDAPVKCMTCEEVHAAYGEMNWQFDDGSGFKQCVEEGYPDYLAATKHHGCRIRGTVTMPRVPGNSHFAPGESAFLSTSHSHDSSTYNSKDMPYNFAHEIHESRFGTADSNPDEPTPAHSLDVSAALGSSNGHRGNTDIKDFQFRYNSKIVGTEYNYASGEQYSTNQYSVTAHERPSRGGRDDDHPNSVHKSGGIPGIWMTYDFSPMKVVETEVRGSSFGMSAMNIFAIIGAVITTAALVDRGVYAVDQALKARKQQ